MEGSVFGFLDCWDRYLYIGILASLLMLSLTLVAKQCSCKAFFESLWNFVTIILSDTMIWTKKGTGNIRVVIMVWLFAKTILLSLFSGLLFESIINAKIIDRIESREQLYSKEHWKSSKILVPGLDTLDFLLTCITNNNSMAKDFPKRSELILASESLRSDTVQMEMFKKVLDTNAVLCANKLSMYYLLRRAQENFPNIMDQC